MRAIETMYKGYRFRSRLEARWAVFFDALKIEWQYEPEGFELPSGRYLPDFFVRMRADHLARQRFPGAGYWLEVKGAAPTPTELRLIEELCTAGPHKGYLVQGLPGDYLPIGFPRATVQKTPLHPLLGVLLSRVENWFKDPVSSLRWAAFTDECSPVRGHAFDGSLVDAILAARGARFEHGESGAPRK